MHPLICIVLTERRPPCWAGIRQQRCGCTEGSAATVQTVGGEGLKKLSRDDTCCCFYAFILFLPLELLTVVGLLCSCNSVCSCVGHSDLNWCVSGKFEVKVLVHFFLTPKEFKCVCLCVNDVRMDEKLFHCPQVQHLLSEWIERLLRGRFKKSQKSLDPNFKSDSSNAFTLFFLICFIKKNKKTINIDVRELYYITASAANRVFEHCLNISSSAAFVLMSITPFNLTLWGQMKHDYGSICILSYHIE